MFLFSLQPCVHGLMVEAVAQLYRCIAILLEKLLIALLIPGAAATAKSSAAAAAADPGYAGQPAP
jgi:hypothetical protein